MILNRKRVVRRTAAALVETAAIASVFCMLIFGVLEYCRFIFMKQLIDNAAREGARYAVVHSYDSTLDADTRAVILAKMTGLDKKMRNFTINLYHADSSGNRITEYDTTNGTGYAYSSDSSGNYVLDNTGTKSYTKTDSGGTYLLDSAKSKVYVTLDANTGTVSGVNAAQFNTYVANSKIQSISPMSDAAFGQYIAVEITADYDPITPALLRFGQTLKIRTKALMISEAN